MEHEVRILIPQLAHASLNVAPYLKIGGVKVTVL